MKNLTLKFKNFSKLTKKDLSDICEIGSWLTDGSNLINQDFKTAAELYSEVMKYAPVYDNDETRRELAMVENNYGDVLIRQENTVNRDVEKAIKLFESSIKKGNVLAMVNLGYYYLNGVKDDKGFELKANEREALRLTRQAALTGHPKALYNLACIYHYGRGVKKNYEFSLEIHRKLITEYDYTESYFYLGYYHEHGLGGAGKSKDLAFKFFLAGASKGDDYAASETARCYQNGIGVTKDCEEALKWYLIGGKRGDGAGYYGASYLCAHGLGVEKNLDLAEEYFKLATKLSVNDVSDQEIEELKKTIEEERKKEDNK